MCHPQELMDKTLVERNTRMVFVDRQAVNYSAYVMLKCRFI